MWTRLTPLAAAALALSLWGAAARADEPRDPTARRGVLMGLDPGLALRMDDTGLPVYARLDLRIGGCVRPWLQIGGAVRADLLVTITRGAEQRRYEIGPVATFFLARGLFARLFVHLAGFEPVSIAAGAQAGYELDAGRFTAIGLYAGAGAQIPFDGEPPLAYDFSAGFYFTAYDLAQRSGRDPGGY